MIVLSLYVNKGISLFDSSSSAPRSYLVNSVMTTMSFDKDVVAFCYLGQEKLEKFNHLSFASNHKLIAALGQYFAIGTSSSTILKLASRLSLPIQFRQSVFT